MKIRNSITGGSSARKLNIHIYNKAFFEDILVSLPDFVSYPLLG
jgi:hypothetical protein